MWQHCICLSSEASRHNYPVSVNSINPRTGRLMLIRGLWTVADGPGPTGLPPAPGVGASHDPLVSMKCIHGCTRNRRGRGCIIYTPNISIYQVKSSQVYLFIWMGSAVLHNEGNSSGIRYRWVPPVEPQESCMRWLRLKLRPFVEDERSRALWIARP